MLTLPERSRRAALRAAERAWTRAWVLALFAVVTAGTLADTARAADARTRFVPYSGDKSLATKARPLSMDSTEPVKVVVRLQSESVAEARARVATHTITADEERAVVAVAHRDHVAVHPAIQGLGGRVVAEYHHALNGVAVLIPRGQVASLATLPGVRSVHRVNTYTLNNATGVPYLDAPAVWQGHPALKGEGVKIAIIDTGIDYTHADFGGPGTAAAFATAAAASAAPADPALFGPGAPKVKGGIDLVGDAYDASDPTKSVPVPDPNPLDCNGHGTHVAGTAAGFGVAGGARYAGPYSAGAYATTRFDVGPGVAPKADLYAVRIFGCSGSTNLATEAIDWAVQNHMDVINLSLGSAFGTEDTADAIAAENAAKAGITVIAAAGNKGPAPYVADTPGTGTHVISAAAMDARQVYPNGVRVALSSGSYADGLEDNTLPLPNGAPALVVLRNGAGLGFGCADSDYAGVQPGALVIVSRGNCTFDAKVVAAQHAGAVAIGVVNNRAGFIGNPAIPSATIPFIDLLQSDAGKFLAATASVTASIAPVALANAGFESLAGFSSGGPRFGDSFFKPNVSAPGVGVLSAGSGSGNGAANESGTSMATPHVAGVAALTREAHPRWRERAIEAAIVETANPGKLSAGDPRLSGAGVVQPVGAAATQVVAFDEDGNASLSFGFEESTRDYSASRELKVHNYGHDHVRFNVSYSPASTATGVPHTVTLGRTSLSLDGNDDAELQVTVRVPVATVGATHDAAFNDLYHDVAGYIVLTPAGGSGAPTLTIPYYLTPRARSHLDANLPGSFGAKHPQASLKLSNRGGAISGTADLYAWGLSSPPQGDPYFDTRAVGVASNVAADGSDSFLVFAVNTWTRFSNAAIGEWDILIDVSGDGQPDFVLFSGDRGYWATGTFDGTVIDLLFDVAKGTVTPLFLADAPTDGSTVLLPVYASQLGVTPKKPTFSYAVQYFNNISGAGYAMPGQARFNAFSPSITNAAFYTVPPGVSGAVPVAIDPVQWASAPALGLMVVSVDNASGPAQAQLLRANH